MPESDSKRFLTVIQSFPICFGRGFECLLAIFGLRNGPIG